MSSIRSPAEHRQISDFVESELKVELRQDLNAAKLAWGLTFEGYSADYDFRSSEVDSFRELRRLDAFIETTWIAGHQDPPGPAERARRFRGA